MRLIKNTRELGYLRWRNHHMPKAGSFSLFFYFLINPNFFRLALTWRKEASAMVSFLAAQLRDFFGAGPPPIVCAGNRPMAVLATDQLVARQRSFKCS